MNSNNQVDKVYLALEMTKTWINGNASRDTILDSYNFFLNGLSGVDDYITIDRLKAQNKALHDSYNQLKETYKQDINTTLEPIKRAIEEGKGDMEPTLYDSLINTINSMGGR